MKELKSILTVTQSEFIVKESLLDDFSTKNSLISQLIDNTLRTDIQSDQEAAVLLYGKNYDKHAFEELKSKVKHRALTSLLVYDIRNDEQHVREAMQHKLNKMLAQANLLLFFGSRSAGVRLLLKINALASKYLFNETRLISTHMLRSHYWFVGDKPKYKQASIQLSKLLIILRDEYYGEDLYNTTTMPYVKSSAKKTHLAKSFRNAISQITNLKHLADSYSLQTNMYRLKVSYYQLLDDHKDAIKECGRASAFLDKKHELSSPRLSAFFLLSKCESLLFLRRYDEAVKATDRLRKLIPAKNPSRIIVERLAFLSHIQSLNIFEADKIYKEVQRLPSFTMASDRQREEWLLYKMYLDLVKSMTSRNIDPINYQTELKINSMDKHGNHLAFLILECLSTLLRKDYNAFSTTDKKIDNYLYRHLNRSAENKRSATFLKMIRIAIKDECVKEVIVQKTSKPLSYLSIKDSSTFLEPIEIIPYDMLWNLLIKAI